LEKPVEFGALDGKPVHVLFSLISPTVRAHLYLLSRLVFALRDPILKEVLLRVGSREEILNEIKRVEDAITKAAAPTLHLPQNGDGKPPGA
jgi:PTS system nitrogen regulatory IIA component